MLLIVLHYQSTSLILNKTRNYFKQRILTKKIVNFYDGKILKSGSPKEIINDSGVKQVYLGKKFSI